MITALLFALLSLLLLTSLIYVQASPTHLYIPQLLTHCLATMICAMVMIVMCMIKHLPFCNMLFS